MGSEEFLYACRLGSFILPSIALRGQLNQTSCIKKRQQRGRLTRESQEL